MSGVITTAPEISRLRNGVMLTKFAVIVADEFPNGRAKFHRLDLTAFDQPAEAASMLKAGERVVIEGSFDTFSGVSASGKPFARVTFKALAVERTESPIPAPAAEEKPMSWFSRPVEELFLELPQAERDVFLKAIDRVATAEARRTQVMAPEAIS